jgi:hypothetical protein
MVLAVLLLFSIASAKRDDYILPALPPLAILFAAQFVCPDEPQATHGSVRKLAATLRNGAVGGGAGAILIGTLAIFLFVRFGGGLGMPGSRLASSDESYAAIYAYGISRLSAPFMLFVILTTACSSVALAGIWYARPLVSGAGFGLLCVAGSILWIGTVKPIEASTRSVETFAASVRSQVGNAPIYVAHPDPELSWYYGRGIPVLPRAIALSGPWPRVKTYYVGRPGDLATIDPSVRKHMQMIIQSHVLGDGGQPTLYLLESWNQPVIIIGKPRTNTP